MDPRIEIPRTGSAEIDAQGRRVAVTRVERPMWPVAGLTKADLLDYYARVAPALLPHLAGRPLRVIRFPDGVHARGVVDAELAGAPEWIPVREGGPVVTDIASLLWVVNHAAVELHVPLSPDPDSPTCVLFEIEPGTGRSLPDACVVAIKLHERLTRDGLQAHVKTSGAFGLHVAVPVNGGATAAAARAYGRAVAEALAAADPGAVTCDARRAGRANRVLVDWRPNAPRRWTIPPYSLRAMLPGPGVSAPVTWEEVAAAAEGDADALRRSPEQVIAAFARAGDAWWPVLDAVQALPDAA